MEATYHLDIIQSAKKYDKYAEAEHYDVGVSMISILFSCSQAI